MVTQGLRQLSFNFHVERRVYAALQIALSLMHSGSMLKTNTSKLSLFVLQNIFLCTIVELIFVIFFTVKFSFSITCSSQCSLLRGLIIFYCWYKKSPSSPCITLLSFSLSLPPCKGCNIEGCFAFSHAYQHTVWVLRLRMGLCQTRVPFLKRQSSNWRMENLHLLKILLPLPAARMSHVIFIYFIFFLQPKITRPC